MNLIPKWFRQKSVFEARFWGDPDSQVGDSTSVRATEAQTRNLTPTEQYELSIAVNAAVNAICRNLSKCVLRVFTRSGREVVGGDLFDLFAMPGPKFSQRKLIWEIASWLNISGEYFVNLANPDNEGRPTALLPVPPPWIEVSNPVKPPKNRDAVVQWRHRWPDGTEELIRDDYLIFERLFNPNARSIRGLSPLVTGGVQVSGAYYAERYNKQFFENGAIPSHIVKLPAGTSKQDRDAFSRRYMATYSNAANQGHRVAIIAGDKDFSVTPLEQSFQDGAFMEMQKRGDLKVGQLYRVPAINMGIYDKTRFDTANEERKLFLEETLEPQAELIAESFQNQLVDPFYKFSEVTTTSGRRIKECPKGLQKQFEKAEGERRGAGLMVILDTDTLPVKHDVLEAKTKSALEMREAYHMSPQEVADWTCMDIEPRKERNDVWIPNNFINITHPEQNAMLVPGVKPGGAEDKPAKEPSGAGSKSNASHQAEKLPPDRVQLKSVAKFLRQIRRPTFDALDAGGIWSLEEGYKIAGDEALNSVVKRVRHAVRKLGTSQSAKAYFASVDPADLLAA